MNKEYKTVVMSGLQRLMTLRLQGHPPADNMRAVGEIWLDALHTCGNWNDSRHLDGLVEAFKSAERELDRFPSPVEIRRRKPQVIDAYKALPSPPKTTEQQAKIDQIIKEIFNNLDVTEKEEI